MELNDEICLSVPGGLAGQLFAVSSGLWLASKRNVKVRLIFQDTDNGHSEFAVQALLDTNEAHRQRITYSSVSGENWLPTPNSVVPSQKTRQPPVVQRFLTLARPASAVRLSSGVIIRTRSAVLGFIANRLGWEKTVPSGLVLSQQILLNATPGQLLAGYPSDLSVVEQSWSSFRQALAESGKPNFADAAGNDDFVAIHWRLGDYVGNSFHGAVSWDSISSLLSAKKVAGKKIRLFTDSPELASKMIQEAGFREDIDIVSGSIWGDIYEMSRAKVFIGTNSQVSLLVAIAIKKSRKQAIVFLPKPFFSTAKWRQFFLPPPKHRLRFRYYPADFTQFSATDPARESRKQA